MTYSISARCPDTGAFGIAITSSSISIAVPARCAWVGPLGLVVTQNVTDPALGPAGLALLRQGLGAKAVLGNLLVTVFEAVLFVASDRSSLHGRETAHCINNQARNAAAHRKIAAAASERYPTRAEDAMRAHLASVQQQLIEHAFPRPLGE